MINQYNYQKYLLKALVSEKRYWHYIDDAYDEIVDRIKVRKVSNLLNVINELPPQALLRGIKLLTIMDVVSPEESLALQRTLLSKIFRKEIDYCDKNRDNLTYAKFLHRFGGLDKMTMDEILKLSSFYIYIRVCFKLPPDDSKMLEETFASAEMDLTYQQGTTSKKMAQDWLLAHDKPKTLSDLQYDESLFTEEFKPLEEISKQENIPMRAYENYEFTRNDIVNMIDIANAMRTPYDLNKYMTTAYIMKSLARYAAECKDAYLELALSPEASPNKTIKKRLAKAEADIAELNKRIDSKQEQLNELQQKFDRQQKVLMQAQDENARLEEYTALLEQQLEAAGTEYQTEVKNVPEVNLDGKKVVVIGGHDSWQQRVKEQFPDLIYIQADNINFDATLTRTADIIIFNFLHCSHSLFYRLRENCDKDKIIYLASNNIDNLKRVLANA